MTIDPRYTSSFVLKLKPGAIDAYRERHDALWPEMRQALLEQGIIHYEIYYHSDERLLFAHVVRSGPFDTMLPEAPAITRWREHMRDLMELEDNRPYRRVLDRVFLLMASPAP